MEQTKTKKQEAFKYYLIAENPKIKSCEIVSRGRTREHILTAKEIFQQQKPFFNYQILKKVEGLN